MIHRLAWVCFLGLVTLAASEKKLPIEQNSNELVEITAIPILDRDQMKQELNGLDPGPDIVIVKMVFRPVSDKPLLVSLDDFTLFSNKDGQHATAYAPSQIAGDTTLVVTPNGARNGGLMGNNGGPSFGGIPIGRSRGLGNAPSTVNSDAKVETINSDKPNPLLSELKAKCLQEKETTETIKGLLYFQMTGKFKSKDLELHYKGPGGRLAVRFRP